MKIYAVSKGEGKQLNVKNTKFFTNKTDAENYRNSLTTIADFSITRKYNAETNELIWENKWFEGKNVSESDKEYFTMNWKSGALHGQVIEVEWVKDEYNPYTITEIEVN